VSQPFIVALMVDLLSVQPDDTVLEVGTGLGYGAAILGELCKQVWSVEIVEEFATEAELRLGRLGYKNIRVRIGDGSKGWAEHAPFDKILVASASGRVPPALVDQLKPGGRLVMPIGPEEEQRLTILDKDAEGEISLQKLNAVRFSRLETVL
jgi:protein-L-isoaspartate(D-aspartate) O-methyltransferase